MMKFTGNDRETGRPLLGIGLSRENCERLLKGEPIQFSTDNMPGLPSVDVYIMAGETEDEMAASLVEAGAMTPDRIHVDRTLKYPHIRAAADQEPN